MATNSGRGARRSSRLKKPPVLFSLQSAKKIAKAIRNRSTQHLRRSPRLKDASFGEKSEQFFEEEAKDDKISNVEKLLKTGYLNGLRISCLSEGRQGYLPGIIKNGGFLCGCSECGYNGKVLSAKMFEKHAGANSKFQTDHIFLRNNLNLYEVSQFVRNNSEEDLRVKILKLRVDLSKKEFSEEPQWGSTRLPTARRSKRKRREMGFQRSIVTVENDTSKRLRTLLRLEDAVINKVEEICSVEDLLKTGLLEGASVSYISEKNQVELPGIIKGTGYVCGCSKCSYTKETFSAGKFKEHARCHARSPNKCIFFSNKISIFEAANKLKGIHGNDLENKLEKFISEVEFRDQIHISKRDIDEELEKDKSSEGSNHLKKLFEGSGQVLKCYRRYNPKRRLVDVQGLLSTGLLEGFRVTYKRNEARLEACIQGAEYKCGCSSCNYTKVISARDIERHARELSDNPNENIYLDNGMTLYNLVKELKGMTLYLLGGSLEDKIKCPPNYNSFEIWKGSGFVVTGPQEILSDKNSLFFRELNHCLVPLLAFGSYKMIDDSPNFRSNFEKQPEVNSKPSSVQSKLMDEVSISTETQNIDKILDTSDVGNDDSLKSLDPCSDQCLNQPIESTNSNFQHCLVSEPIIVSNLAEAFTDRISEGIDDLAEDPYPKKASQSKSKDEASFSEATKNIWMGISSDTRDNNTLENLNSISVQSLNLPNESCNSNSQQFSDKPTIFTEPAETVIDGQSEGINDLAEASMPKNTFHPYNVEFNTPGSSGLHTPGPSISEGMTVVHEDSLNVGRDEWHLVPASRKRRSPRNFKFMKCNYNFYSPSSLKHGIETTVQKVRFKFSGAESTTASDVMEAATADPDYMPLQRGSKEGLTDEERTSLGGITATRKGRDVYLHKRILEEGGLPDGTVLTYQCHNKVLITGVKEGNAIKCACHNLKFAPSQFEAHAGMGQRRQPYRHIYNSDGKTLHELSLELPDIPRPSSGVPYSSPIIHLQHKCLERTAGPIVKKEFYVPIRNRLNRVLLSQKGVLARCAICKESHATMGDEADPKLVIFCNQCDSAYHIGCLEDHKSFKIEDVHKGNWFCCTDCSGVHNSLKSICALGAKPVPTPFFDLLKNPRTSDNNPGNLSWQIFRGGNTEDHMLLSQSLRFLKIVFKPILLGRQEMMRQMVFGKQVAGTGLDFRGVHFIVIKLDEEIISIAVLRVFGKSTAELPLVTTSKVWRQQGYCRMLLFLIEDLLHLLQVRLLVSPVPDKLRSLWIDKFGFVKPPDQKVDMLKEQHGVMLFEDTALLEKEISC